LAAILPPEVFYYVFARGSRGKSFSCSHWMPMWVIETKGCEKSSRSSSPAAF